MAQQGLKTCDSACVLSLSTLGRVCVEGLSEKTWNLVALYPLPALSTRFPALSTAPLCVPFP